MKEKFIDSIHSKTKIRVTFYSKEDGCNITRLCAPMDFAPFRGAKDGLDRYHLWDYESDKRNHNLPLLPERISNMEFLNDTFDPSEFVTWTCNWTIPRDWGIHS